MKRSWPATVLLLGLLGGGCFNPHIKPGAFLCAENRGCPDNFHCSDLDNRCYPPDAGPDLPPAPVCDSLTPAPTCARPPASGQDCNTTCGTNCTCGWCGVNSAGAAACLRGTPGSATAGMACDPSNTASCAPGLYCRAECGGGRCYKFCDTSNDCASGASCTFSVPGTSILLCSDACDPVSQSGCPSGYGCYPSGLTGECDCAGTGKTGASCQLAHDCVPGDTCIGLQGAPTCQKMCGSNADCGGSGTCTNFGATYGYCS
jgi:hypothetical protein